MRRPSRPGCSGIGVGLGGAGPPPQPGLGGGPAGSSARGFVNVLWDGLVMRASRRDGRGWGAWPGCWNRACQSCLRWRRGGRMRVLSCRLRGPPAPVLFWRLRFRTHERRAAVHSADPLIRRSVCAVGQPACPQVSRCIGLSGSDREFPALTGRSGTQRARRLRSRTTVGTSAPWSSSPSSELRITRVFSCVARGFKARA